MKCIWKSNSTIVKVVTRNQYQSKMVFVCHVERVVNNMEQLTYIALQTGGYYYDACLRAGFCNPGESGVIEYKQFMKYVNEGEVTRPVFVSLDYGKCLDVAKELQEAIYQSRAVQERQMNG